MPANEYQEPEEWTFFIYKKRCVRLFPHIFIKEFWSLVIYIGAITSKFIIFSFDPELKSALKSLCQFELCVYSVLICLTYRNDDEDIIIINDDLRVHVPRVTVARSDSCSGAAGEHRQLNHIALLILPFFWDQWVVEPARV